MIARISGTLIKTEPGSVIIETGGVGYRIFVGPNTISNHTKEKDEVVSLWTYLAVKENALDLYGFEEEQERNFFTLLLEVPGIGPKSALAILSLASIETLQQSITSGDTTYLTKVSGIGKKMAQKIVLELKDKVGSTTFENMNLQGEADAVAALRSLGYSLEEAREALKRVPSGIDDTSARVREALKLLDKKE